MRVIGECSKNFQKIICAGHFLLGIFFPFLIFFPHFSPMLIFNKFLWKDPPWIKVKSSWNFLWVHPHLNVMEREIQINEILKVSYDLDSIRLDSGSSFTCVSGASVSTKCSITSLSEIYVNWWCRAPNPLEIA